jgi:hypothetical protein
LHPDALGLLYDDTHVAGIGEQATIRSRITAVMADAQISAATNKAESYNAFSGWLAFGSEVIERNDPAEQEKMIKFNSLLANCAIFHTTLDMTVVIRQLIAEGWIVDLDDLATPPRISPSESSDSANTRSRG